MRKIVQILLFIISYTPLYFILFFQNISDDVYNDKKEFEGWEKVIEVNTISISFLALVIFSVLLYFFFFWLIKKEAPGKLTIKEIKDNNNEHLSYLATYILPFVGLQFDSWQSLLATIALFGVLGHIYIKTNLILTNPTLTLFGYEISKIVDSQDYTKILIHKHGLKANQEINTIYLNDNLFIHKS